MNLSANHTRNTFILLFLIFFLPLLMSWMVYLYHDHFKLTPHPHGMLLAQAIPTGDFITQGQHKWRMLYKAEHCQPEEMNMVVFRLHQMRKAMGSDAERIALLLLSPEKCQIANQYDFTQINLALETQNAFKKALQLAHQHARDDKIYLIDPHDNLFMAFSALENPVYIYQDVKKLLKLSRIG